MAHIISFGSRRLCEVLLAFYLTLLEQTRHKDLIIRSGESGQERVRLSSRTAEMQTVRVALLRAYQQLCVDRHVRSVVAGTSSPGWRTKAFSIRNIKSEDSVPLAGRQLLALGSTVKRIRPSLL